MDEMRQGIGLQAYGQTDPLVAYKREAHDMWDQLLGEHPQPDRARHLPRRAGVGAAGKRPFPTAVPSAAENDADDGEGRSASPRPIGIPLNLRENRQDQAGLPGVKSNGRKVGRNDPCPCGSGKKYKRCHGVDA